MPRFECKKCGSLVVVEKDAKTAICQICGKKQHVPANAMDDQVPVTCNNFDPQRDHYEQLVRKARKYRDIKILTDLAKAFDRLGDYDNSREMAEYCRSRIAEEKAKRSAESEYYKVQDQYKKRARIINIVKMTIITAAVIGLVIGITMFSNRLTKEPSYTEAVAYMENGQYDYAISIFNRLGPYKDSQKLLTECHNIINEQKYLDALEYMDEGLYIVAQDRFERLDGYKDSDALIIECKYQLALNSMKNKNYYNALRAFLELGDYKDSAELAELADAKIKNPSQN